jgi:hypothetical protein
VITTHEITITAAPPFDRAKSDPAVVEALEGRGQIQWGDVLQLGKGGYNGLVDILPVLVGPVFGQAVKAADLPKAQIDPRFGGAAMMGQQLGENLALEAAAGIPALVRALQTSERLAAALRSPALAPLTIELFSGGGAEAARVMRGPAGVRTATGVIAAGPAGARTGGLAVEVVGQIPVVSDAARTAAQAEYVGQKSVANDILLEAGIARPRSGWYESEILNHLRRLAEGGNTSAAESYKQFTAAIEALRALPGPTGREIFWDARWIRWR